MHGHPLTGHTSDAAIPKPKTAGTPSTPVAGR
jgi:hypothetical protein